MGKIKNAGRHMQYGGRESASLSASWRRQPTIGKKTHQTLVNSVDLLQADSNECSLQSFELLQMIQDDESATPLLMEAPHKEKNKQKKAPCHDKQRAVNVSQSITKYVHACSSG